MPVEWHSIFGPWSSWAWLGQKHACASRGWTPPSSGGWDIKQLGEILFFFPLQYTLPQLIISMHILCVGPWNAFLVTPWKNPISICNISTTFENQKFLTNVNIHLPFDLAILSLGFYPREISLHMPTKQLTRIFVASLSRTAKNRNVQVSIKFGQIQQPG